MKPPLRAIFFDAGGTLIHVDPACILDALAKQGLPRDLAAYRAADLAARRAVVAWLAGGNHPVERSRWQLFARTLLEALGCPPAAEDAVRAAVSERHAAATLWSYTEPGTTEVLARLRGQGFILGIVSNADGRVATFLEHAGLAGVFDFVVDSALVGIEKPDPRIFALACERAGVAAAEAAHVGDVYQVDVMGARLAGVTPILFDPDDLLPAADCERIRSLAQLPDLLSLAAVPA
jgi:putative hydrolase of the HAD superfamily